MQPKTLDGLTAALALCALWIVMGLTGHEPWKPDEAYTFGLVLNLLQSGDWVIPSLGGEPFMEKPPVFVITAALFAKLFGPWLPLHDAARLATGFYLGLTVLFTSLSAKELGDEKGRSDAPLLFISCIGLFELSHRLQPDISLMAGITMSLYALALIPRRVVLGGLLLGTGTGIAFLSKGLIGPGFVGLITLGLLAFPHWRTVNYFKSWGWAFAAGLPWLLLWPLLLYLRAPEQFHEWFWINNVGRFIGSNNLGPASEPWYYTKTLAWFAWPALPLALWAVWKNAADGRLRTPGMQLPLVAFVIMAGVLGMAGDSRSNYALPLLPPLALLASVGMQKLHARGQGLWYWSGVGLFGLLTLILWLGWVGMQLGAPAIWVARLEKMQPGYVDQLRPLAASLALLISAGWLWSLRQVRKSPGRGVWSWAAGTAVVWGLFCLLWLPFVDYGRSYRSVMTDLGQHLDAGQCVASNGLREPQRAMLDYYANTKTQRVEVLPNTTCPQMITVNMPETPAGGWTLLWQGTRPNDNGEVLRLYRHE